MANMLIEFKIILIIEISFLILIKCEQIIIYNSFNEYKASLNKTYFRKYEEVRSQKAYEENLQIIREHNELYEKGETTFQLRTNAFADMNNGQYLNSYVRLERSPRDESDVMVGSSKFHLMENHDLPSSLDWRKLGFNTSVDDQLKCGSCYAYSISRCVEGQVFKRLGRNIPLSQQQLVDCSVKEGNHGCHGGSLRNTLRYLEKYGGLMRREDYPYSGKLNKCQFKNQLAIVNITSWAILPFEDESALQIAVTAIGPIAVSINASPRTFQLYSHGVYDDLRCKSNVVNHAMLVVGYTKDYWILKNWWGEHWGDKGYMKLKRNLNLCGVANYAAYVIV